MYMCGDIVRTQHGIRTVRETRENGKLVFMHEDCEVYSPSDLMLVKATKTYEVGDVVTIRRDVKRLLENTILPLSSYEAPNYGGKAVKISSMHLNYRAYSVYPVEDPEKVFVVDAILLTQLRSAFI